MTVYLLNGFSFLMSQLDSGTIDYEFISSEEARSMCLNATPKVGQKNLAKVLSNEFGFPVEYAPGNIELKDGDKIIVAYLTGKRLPSDATTLPRNVVIEYVKADISENPLKEAVI